MGSDVPNSALAVIRVTPKLTMVQTFFLEKSGRSPTYKANSDALVDTIMRKLSTTSANEIDGRLSDALRNFLFDEGQDLAGRNIFRGRDIGVPTYAGLAKCFGIKPDFKVPSPRKTPWFDHVALRPRAHTVPLLATRLRRTTIQMWLLQQSCQHVFNFQLVHYRRELSKAWL